MKFPFLIIAFFISLAVYPQTATNFTSDDCSGTEHTLFTELDSGKVIVICWVMPCGSCVTPALNAYNIVSSFQSTHPGKVYYYLADDFANTNCPTLDNWATSNGIAESAFSYRFSDTVINMADYGTFGMPKIVVLAGTSHSVFYNENDVLNQVAFTDAINQAIAATGINESKNVNGDNILISYTPSVLNFKICSAYARFCEVDVFDAGGRLVKAFYKPDLKNGDTFSMDISYLPQGVYIVKARTADATSIKRLPVLR